MMEWDSRMHNNHCVKVLKAAIPFFDVEVGESINLEGLFRAIRPFAPERERRMVDLFLQIFQMRRMMEMMQLFQTMQEMQGESRENPDGGNGAAAGGTGTMPSPDMMSMLKAMIPPEQQGMMDTVSAMMTMMQAAEEGSPSGEEGSLSAEEGSPPAEESPENDPPEGAGGGGQDGTVDL